MNRRELLAGLAAVTIGPLLPEPQLPKYDYSRPGNRGAKVLRVSSDEIVILLSGLHHPAVCPREPGVFDWTAYDIRPGMIVPCQITDDYIIFGWGAAC